MFTLRPDFNFGLHFDRDVERKLCHSNGTSRMSAYQWPKQFEDEIRESVEDARLPVEARCRVYHAKDSAPRGNEIEITKFALQAGKNGNGCEAGRGIALFNGEVTADLAKRPGDRAIRILSAVTGDKCPVAHEPNKLKRKHNALRWFDRWR